MTHRPVPNEFAKSPIIHSRQRQSYVYTDAYGNPLQLKPRTDEAHYPIMLPKTDEYGRPYSDGTIKITSITPSATSHTSPTPVPETDTFGNPIMITEGVIKSSPIGPGSTNTTNLHQRTKSQTKAVVINKTYLYIAVGTVTFLLITAAVLLLFVWVMKRKNQRRVGSTEIC